MDYLVTYRFHGGTELYHYTCRAEDAEHALQQFRDDEPDEKLVVVFVVVV